MRTVRMRMMWMIVATLALHAPGVAAEDFLETARARYAEAAYEEALVALKRAAEAPGVDRVELEQYRALCLFALGQTDKAADAMAALVDADPTYQLSSSVASPRVQSLFAEARTRQLPGVVRRLLERGREAHEAGTPDAAREDFALATRLLEDPALAAWPDRETVRVLVAGFTALAEAAARPAVAEPSATAQPSIPDDAAQPVAAVADAAASGSHAAPAGEMENGHGDDDTTAGDVLPPVAVVQAMPAWVPPDQIARSRAYRGVLKVQIDQDGRVTSATIEEPSHPAYDARLIQAARQWVFRPAQRNGRPVASEKIIAVQLHPEG
jgi:TonB family protein